MKRKAQTNKSVLERLSNKRSQGRLERVIIGAHMAHLVKGRKIRQGDFDKVMGIRRQPKQSRRKQAPNRKA